MDGSFDWSVAVWRCKGTFWMSTCVWYLSAVVQILLGGGFKTFRWWAALSVSMYHVTNFHRDPKTVKASVSPVEKKKQHGINLKVTSCVYFYFQSDWLTSYQTLLYACVCLISAVLATMGWKLGLLQFGTQDKRHFVSASRFQTATHLMQRQIWLKI